MKPLRYHTTINIHDLEWDAVGLIHYDDIYSKYLFTLDFIQRERSIIYASEVLDLDIDMENVESQCEANYTDEINDVYDE